MGRDKGKTVAERQNFAGATSEMVEGRVVKKRKTSKKGSDSRKVSKAKPTAATRLAALKKMTFKQTRWVDHELLRSLHIHQEVETIFAGMGLFGLFTMEELAHENETAQFFATLSFYDDTSLDISNENRGVLSFKVNGREYQMTVAQLCATYHFSGNGRVYSLDLDKNEAQNVWTLIADGDYEKGVSKSSLIRHPAIRYAHKVLANTLFARRETGAVKEEELALLIQGIKPYLRTTATNWEIVGFPEPIHFGHYFARRLLGIQEWVSVKEDRTPKMLFGGMITPILRACGVEFTNVEGSIARIDASYLYSSHMLIGRLRNSYGYQFTLLDEKKIIVLPNRALTRITARENILFAPKDYLLYDSRRDGKFTGIPKDKSAPTTTEEQQQEEQTEQVIGSRRYDFMPYGGPIHGTALQAAHEEIGYLRRLGKWQTKQIKKLVKTVKKQGKKIKEQGRFIKEFVNPTCASEPRGEDADMPSPMPLAVYREEGAETGTSSRRQGKQAAPLSPSSEDSGNPCYSMDSSSDSP